MESSLHVVHIKSCVIAIEERKGRRSSTQDIGSVFAARDHLRRVMFRCCSLGSVFIFLVLDSSEPSA